MQKYKCIKEFELPMYDEYENPTSDYNTVHKDGIYEYTEGYVGESDIRMYLEDGDEDFGFIDITFKHLEEYFMRIQ